MQDILDSGITEKITDSNNRWTYYEQTCISNVKIETVRNLDNIPCLTAIKETTKPKLLEIQRQVMAGLQ